MLAILLACSRPDIEPRESEPPRAVAFPIVTAQVDAETVPLVRTILVTIDDDAAVEMVCADEDDVGDEFDIADDTKATTRRLVVAGLLADTHYTCTISSGSVETSVEFRSSPLPPSVPEMIFGGTPSDGYTIFSHLDYQDDGFAVDSGRILIVDPLGRVRWYQDVVTHLVDVDPHVLEGERVLYGGAGIPPTILGVDHETLLTFGSGEEFHHVVEPLSGNRVILQTTVDNTDGTNTWKGFEISIRDLNTQAVLYSWASQTAVDRGQLPPGTADGDPYHANGAQVLEGKDEPHLLLVSVKNRDQIIGVDMETGDIVWTLGRGGDFALVDEKGAALPDEQWFEGQHGLEAHWPKLLMFDNGPVALRTDGTSSRALEVEIDDVAMTVTPTWSYVDAAVHEAVGGDASRLASGNVLMAWPHCLPCGSSDENARLVEVTPADEVVWRIDFVDEHDTVYSSERVDACALFSNRAYCPDL